MRSVMSHQFSRVAQVNHPRSQFDRSHGIKTTFNAGYLIPVYVDEALPGDTFNLRMAAFARFATLEFPIMDNVFLDSHFFAVPLRLLQTNFVKLMGEQDNPGDSIDFLTPIVDAPTTTGFANGSLYDYFGVPTEVDGFSVVNYWARAYNLIWNYWFRDQNLQDSVVVDKDDGPDDPADYVPLPRGKRHDYFTSCTPWPQKGDAVVLPLGTSAPVTGLGEIVTDTTVSDRRQSLRNSLTPWATVNNDADFHTDAAGWLSNSARTVNQYIDLNGTHVMDADNASSTLIADLSTATAATINDIRYAVVVQQILEQDARGGTRYPEMIWAHFQVKNPDARMQWPEYLGGGSTPLNVHTVPNTTDAGTAPQATLAAYGTTSFNNHGFIKSFTEHCVIIGLVSIRADLTYQQGLNRMFSRRTRYDFWFPEYAHLGEQSVLNKEIYVDGTSADDEVFGYQERGAEYRYKPSIITGQFRSNYAQSLDAWHLSQDFGSRPALNDQFIVEDPPIDRVIAVSSEPHMIFDGYVSLKTARCMPMYSTPGLTRF